MSAKALTNFRTRETGNETVNPHGLKVGWLNWQALTALAGVKKLVSGASNSLSLNFIRAISQGELRGVIPLRFFN